MASRVDPGDVTEVTDNITDAPPREAGDDTPAVLPARNPISLDQPGRRPPPLFQNDQWVVDSGGLDLRENAKGPIGGYFVAASRLLNVRHGSTNISDWAMHLAGKSWVKDKDAMLEALAKAIEIHHPGQTVIDMGASIEAVQARLAKWRANRRPRDPDHRGADHAAHTHSGYEKATDSPSIIPAAEQSGPASSNWVGAYPAKHAGLLRHHGMPPSEDHWADDFNRRLIELAEGGLTDAALSHAIEAHLDDLFGDGPAPADLYDPDCDDVGD